MKTTNKTEDIVSAFDAKTHLSKLLNEVEEGHVITITKRGKPVAKLVPWSENEHTMSRSELMKEFTSIRQNVKGRVDIKSYINEGRKY